MIHYENEYNKEFSIDIPVEELGELLLVETCRDQQCPFEVECNLLILAPEEMRILNRETRGIDKETDVLSYPNIDFEQPGNFSVVSMDDIILFSPDTGRLMLGDIVISYEKVLNQANEYGHSVKRELAFLIVHSLLHLMGYDHMEDDERERMEMIQNAILNTLNIKR